MLKNGILMLIFIYLIMALSLITAIVMSKIIFGKTKEVEFPIKLTVFVMMLIAIICLVPIIEMIISAANNEIFILMDIGFSMLLVTIPIAYLVIIPLVEKECLKLMEKELGAKILNMQNG